MKFIKLDLLTLLISLFLFASCNKSSNIGLDLNQEDAIVGDLIELPVTSKTVTDDPSTTFFGTASTNPARIPFGTLSDPILGTTEASLAMSVNLPSNGFSFGTNAALDSAVLVLPFSTGFYGDTTTTVYDIAVQRLKINLSNETNFKSNRTWPHEDEIIGNFSGKIKPTTPVRVMSVVNGAPDTLVKRLPGLRIKLSNNFVRDQLMNLGPTSLTNNVTFNEAFKGLYVSATKNAATGGMMFLDFTASNSEMPKASVEVYYRKQNATTAANTDTLMTSFEINQTTGPVAASIKHNFSNAVKEQLEDNSTKQYDVTYVQSLSGLRTKISFPTLKDLSKQLGGKIVVNKAELVVDLSAGTDISPFTPAPSMAIYQYDIAGQRAMIQDQATNEPRNTGNFGGGYSTGQKMYRFIMTAYVQDLIDGKTSDYGTFLAPAPALTTEYNISPPLINAERAVLGSFANGTNKMKLNIYYTKY